MSEKDKNQSFDLMQDTQYLLQGLDETQGESFRLEDILAEFGSEEEAAPPVEETEAAVEEERPQPPGEGTHPKIIAFPIAAVERDDTGGEETIVLPDLAGQGGGEYISADELFGLTPRPVDKAAVSEVPEETVGETETQPEEPEKMAEPRPLTMEDIVASTVDAVKAEHERHRDEQRRRVEKARKKREGKKREPQVNAPLPATACEQSPKETAAFHKRRYYACRKSLVFSVPMLVLMWLPWILSEMGISLPYFSAAADNAAVCVLAAQAVLCVVCAPLFRAAVEELKERCCTFYTYTALTNLATLLDEVTLLALPRRSAVAPLGGIASTALVFALWGLKNYHRGMWETFRTVTMGEPSCIADRCEAGIAKGLGRSEGFVTRANMESTASQWQRLLLPVLVVASLVFALLSSVGQQQWHDFLWCWSVILCASCSLACPLAYCVPFGCVARRLSRSGTAVAGQYGAAVLAASQKLVVTDTDIFPRTSVFLSGVKLYGEERNRAISYTATLAVQGGGGLARVFETVCQGERIAYQPLEHFHIHDDNGLSGMIRGETVLVGTPLFMRHKGVRLPATLPAKTAVCLAVDGELLAVFAVKYSVNPQVEIALRSLARNGLQLILATRDGNVTPKLLKKLFGTDGKAVWPEISERLALSDPQREAGAPNGLIYREGILPYVELVSLSRRLCQTVRVGNLLSMLGSIFGVLLAFYLTFVGSTGVLTPIMLQIYLLLWVVPLLPLLLGVDRL